MSDDLERLTRRLERERAARATAESIAERVTAQLYETIGELRQANEDARTLNQSLRDFVAIASHDLRGPITAIIGFAQLLSDEWERLDDDRCREFIDVITRQGTQLNALVEDLLTISAIDAGALDPHREAMRLQPILDDVVADFLGRDIEIKALSSNDPEVFANPAHVRRIVMNLLENAIKYGHPPFEITSGDTEDKVEIRVCDHGDGVPDDFIESLFKRFARADNEVTRQQKGTGLGLSIVSGLAKANGGATWYEPNSPHGARFCISLPKTAGI